VWVFDGWYQLRGVRVPADLGDRSQRFLELIEPHDGIGSVSADGVQVVFSLSVQAVDESTAREAGVRIASKAAEDSGLDRDHRLGGEPSIRPQWHRGQAAGNIGAIVSKVKDGGRGETIWASLRQNPEDPCFLVAYGPVLDVEPPSPEWMVD
jgi:hypothetical protein